VHDPKSIGQSSVKANIKLRFTNRAGQQMVVVRSMEVSQKKTTMSFKALDGILRTTHPQTGEKVSMSHKCTELDRQIPMHLGVSKPILDNVVFCPQEDSSWPLMEGAVLKKRFDDIFDSTRYAKALKAIQETKKEYNGIVKDLKADLQGLASHKHAAKGFRQELAQQSEELEDLEENVQALTDEMRKVEDEIKRNEAIAEEVEEQNLIIEEKGVELTRKTSVLDAHRKMLKDDLTNTRSARELKEMLRDFDKQMSAQIEKRQDLIQDARAAEVAIQNIREEDRNLREQIGKLDAQKVAHDERLARRLEKMDALCSEYNIELPTTQSQNMSFTQASVADSVTTFTGGASQDTAVAISAEDMHSFFKSVDEKEADLKQTLANYRKDSERKADEYQEELNDMSAQVKAVENGTNVVTTMLLSVTVLA
jgi:DNA repair protein RAD50